MKKLNKSVCCGILAGALVVASVTSVRAGEEGGTWMKGGAATNQTSKGIQNAQKTVANTQKAITLVTASYTLAASVLSTKVNYYHVLTNVDPIGIVLNALLLHDAKNKHAKWSEDIPELTAQIRQMGSAADLMSECEGAEEDGAQCNELTAKLDRTNVHIKTLENVGLEALKDVSGNKVMITTPELVGGTTDIQEGFGQAPEGVTWTEADVNKIGARKKAHLQYFGTAGVARADMGATVARSEKKIDDKLASFVGSGDGVIAQVKVLCGLDLTLSQRLNLVNMLQGQQVANEAASALQFVEE